MGTEIGVGRILAGLAWLGLFFYSQQESADYFRPSIKIVRRTWAMCFGVSFMNKI